MRVSERTRKYVSISIRGTTQLSDIRWCFETNSNLFIGKASIFQSIWKPASTRYGANLILAESFGHQLCHFIFAMAGNPVAGFHGLKQRFLL